MKAVREDGAFRQHGVEQFARRPAINWQDWVLRAHAIAHVVQIARNSLGRRR